MKVWEEVTVDSTAMETPGEVAFWRVARSAWAWRRFIVGATLLVAVVTVVVVLLMPNQYRAGARVLAPEGSGGGLLSSLGSNFASAARLLGDNAGGSYSEYFAILTSRSMLQTVADTFNLEQVYDLVGDPRSRSKTREELAERTEFDLDEEYEYLTIFVLDESPERAAEMANFYVQELNRRYQALTSQHAGLYRAFVEQRYAESMAALDSLLMATKAFQQQYGIFDLPTQTQAFFEQLGALRAEEARLRVQYDALRAQLGPDNPQVSSLGQALESARRQYQQALAGSEQALPIPRQAVPEAAFQYAMLERERFIQTSILEAVAPMLEMARLEEEKQRQALQVIDEAVAPERKDRPKRTLILIAATSAAFLLSFLLALAIEAWRRNHVYLYARLKGETPVLTDSTTGDGISTTR